MLKVRLRPSAEGRVRARHPWIFDQSIREQNREGERSEFAVVYDRNNEFLAIGLYDPDSHLRIRVLQHGKPASIDRQWWRTRLEDAVARRATLLDEHTNAFRWIHGENDGWPALVLDRYAHTLVLKLYSSAWLPRLAELSSLIVEVLQPRSLVLRLSRNIQEIARKEFDLMDGQTLTGPKVTEPVAFIESGLRFEADVVRGQKTGFFLDQRENRQRVEKLAAGRHVLNAFSFSGGFSVYAVRGGASSVTDLDISAHALENARRNFRLNPELRSCGHETVQADAFEWLAQNREREFDLIILDPPSLAKREQERAGALRAYRKLAENAIAHLRKGGILVACSCSAHVSAEEFFGTVRESAIASTRKFQELCTTGHPADHPATFPEAHYLKAIYLEF